MSTEYYLNRIGEDGSLSSMPLGVSSAGYFGFRANTSLGLVSYTKMMEFLQKELDLGSEIISEYKETMTLEQFKDFLAFRKYEVPGRNMPSDLEKLIKADFKNKRCWIDPDGFKFNNYDFF